MIEDDLEVPENRYVYSPSPRPLMQENLATYIFLAIVATLIVLGLIGYMLGVWTPQ